MPPSVCPSERFLKRELDMIFAREWVCVGRADETCPNLVTTRRWTLPGNRSWSCAAPMDSWRAIEQTHRMSTMLKEGNTNGGLPLSRMDVWFGWSTAGAPQWGNAGFDRDTACRRTAAPFGKAGSG